MKERPILFNGAMVRALLDGRKTQTRHIYKNQKHPDTGCDMAACELVREPQHVIDRASPYGASGDQLWVRETWKTDASLNCKSPVAFCKWPVQYDADGAILKCGSFYGNTDGKTRASTHMPRWASRIMLEIVSVRVERLQDINEADARAEGVAGEPCDHKRLSCEDIGCCDPTARGMYGALWDQINGAGTWAANPWVWCVKFKKVIL